MASIADAANWPFPVQLERIIDDDSAGYWLAGAVKDYKKRGEVIPTNIAVDACDMAAANGFRCPRPHATTTPMTQGNTSALEAQIFDLTSELACTQQWLQDEKEHSDELFDELQKVKGWLFAVKQEPVKQEDTHALITRVAELEEDNAFLRIRIEKHATRVEKLKRGRKEAEGIILGLQTELEQAHGELANKQDIIRQLEGTRDVDRIKAYRQQVDKDTIKNQEQILEEQVKTIQKLKEELAQANATKPTTTTKTGETQTTQATEIQKQPEPIVETEAELIAEPVQPVQAETVQAEPEAQPVVRQQKPAWTLQGVVQGVVKFGKDVAGLGPAPMIDAQPAQEVTEHKTVSHGPPPPYEAPENVQPAQKVPVQAIGGPPPPPPPPPPPVTVDSGEVTSTRTTRSMATTAGKEKPMDMMGELKQKLGKVRGAVSGEVTEEEDWPESKNNLATPAKQDTYIPNQAPPAAKDVAKPKVGTHPWFRLEGKWHAKGSARKNCRFHEENPAAEWKDWTFQQLQAEEGVCYHCRTCARHLYGPQ